MRFLICLLCLVCSIAAFAQTPQDYTRGIGIDQKLNQKIPLDLKFLDESGRDRPLSAYFGRHPVILSLVYYQCPMLCNRVMNGVLAALKTIKLNAAEDFEVVFVSIDPRETPQLAYDKKQSYIRSYNRAGAAEGWHFLTGDKKSIDALANAVGYHYKYDAAKDQFSHGAAIIVLTTDGTLSQYFYGIEFAGQDIRLALVQSSQGKIGTVLDQALLFCMAYDPTTGKYGFVIMRVIRLFGILTVLILGAFIYINLRRERKAKEVLKA